MEVHKHPSTSVILQQALKLSLPYSINLAYRTQHANQTEHAHILATFAPDAGSVPECWAAAYFDRSMRPETELWIFAAGEVPGHFIDDKTSHSNSEEKEEKEEPSSLFCAKCKVAVLSLIDYMSRLALPPLHPTNMYAIDLAKQHEIEYPAPGADGRYATSTMTYMRHLLLPQVLKMGCCHHAVLHICQEAGLVRHEFPGVEAELNKFLFKTADLPETKELPEGLRWGEVREQDLDVVKARTSIPRSTRTLMSLKSVGVVEKKTDTAIAWAFLGLDGSLSTLHTEEGYRGKGIAKAVAARIIQTYSPGLAVDGEGNAWSHADVYVGNTQSESVCRSLGGKAMWKCFWVTIDLDRPGSAANNV